MKTLYPILVSERHPEKSGNYYTDRGEVYFDGKYWKKTPVEYWYTDEPPTQPPSERLPDTRKTISEPLKQVAKKFISNQGIGSGTNITVSMVVSMLCEFAQQHSQVKAAIVWPDDEWKQEKSEELANKRFKGDRFADIKIHSGMYELEKELRTRLAEQNVVDLVNFLSWFQLKSDYATDVREEGPVLIFLNNKGPHREVDVFTVLNSYKSYLTEQSQQQESGEVERGIVITKEASTSESLVEINPEPYIESKTTNTFELSESMEQAAEKLATKICLDFSENKETHSGIKKDIIAFAQQQKPMAVVLTTDDEINRIFDVNATIHETPVRSMTQGVFRKVVKEVICTRMSAANGVDLVDLVESIGKKLEKDSWINYKNGKWYVHMRGHLTTKEFIDYLTEQSQQQNKGK